METSTCWARSLAAGHTSRWPSTRCPVKLFGMPCRVLEVDWLIKTKRAAGRPRDLEMIAELEALREERGDGKVDPIKARHCQSEKCPDLGRSMFRVALRVCAHGVTTHRTPSPRRSRSNASLICSSGNEPLTIGSSRS